jgi:hypothetical protein
MMLLNWLKLTVLKVCLFLLFTFIGFDRLEVGLGLIVGNKKDNITVCPVPPQYDDEERY